LNIEIIERPTHRFAAGAAMSLMLRTANRDVALLHPNMRAKAALLMAEIAKEELPFRIFEAWR
jgi:hypothetical protein